MIATRSTLPKISRSGYRHFSVEARQTWRQERRALEAQASALTLALYRRCVRSARLIRRGNDADEQEFAKREQQRLEATLPKEQRLSMLSLLPPVDREDELRSRADYYMQYARENFVQESDCLSHKKLEAEHIARYLYHLRRGEEHRQWLLSDMQFDDPCDALDASQVQAFETQALEFLQRVHGPTSVAAAAPSERGSADDDDIDDFFDEDGEEAPHGMPSWYKNPRSM